MKFGIKNNEGLNLKLLFLGVDALVLMIFAICYDYLVLAIVFLLIGGGIITFIIIRNIQNLLNYILSNGKTITLYRNKKPVKQINIADIKSLVIGQYVGKMRRAFNPDRCINSNTYIVINDGTFLYKKWTKQELRKKILSDSDGWIAIDFSFKRYAALKRLLPNCEEEIYTILSK